MSLLDYFEPPGKICNMVTILRIFEYKTLLLNVAFVFDIGE